jgi:hypothetical protein
MPSLSPNITNALEGFCILTLSWTVVVLAQAGPILVGLMIFLSVIWIVSLVMQVIGAKAD